MHFLPDVFHLMKVDYRNIFFHLFLSEIYFLMILLVAMIGAIVLTYRERAGVKKQSYVKQISRERDEGVDLVEAERNKGVKIDA